MGISYGGGGGVNSGTYNIINFRDACTECMFDEDSDTFFQIGRSIVGHGEFSTHSNVQVTSYFLPSVLKSITAILEIETIADGTEHIENESSFEILVRRVGSDFKVIYSEAYSTSLGDSHLIEFNDTLVGLNPEQIDAIRFITTVNAVTQGPVRPEGSIALARIKISEYHARGTVVPEPASLIHTLMLVGVMLPRSRSRLRSGKIWNGG
jgi:hypothetical protein